MKLSQFQFLLPKERVAQEPTRWRDECRLMVVHKGTGEIEHRIFKDIIDYFGKGDTFVFNDTKVFPARLYGKKEKTGADIMVFLLRELNREQHLWDVIVDPARKIRIGNKLYFGDDQSLVAEVIDTQPPGGAPCASFTTALTRNSRNPCSASVRFLSRNGPSPRSLLRTTRTTRQSSPRTKARWPFRRPAHISAASCST